MRERPVLCSGADVRGLLDGSLMTLVRRMKPQPFSYAPGPNVHAPKHDGPYFDAYCSEQKTDANPRGMSDRWCWWSPDDRQGPDWIRCPFGQPGCHLWVRETYAELDGRYAIVPLAYRADGEHESEGFFGWKSPVAMPRWASRLTLEVTSVRAVKSPDGVWSWLVRCKRAEAHIA